MEASVNVFVLEYLTKFDQYFHNNCLMARKKENQKNLEQRLQQYNNTNIVYTYENSLTNRFLSAPLNLINVVKHIHCVYV